jgi:uncharacterized membrane protein
VKRATSTTSGGHLSQSWSFWVFQHAGRREVPPQLTALQREGLLDLVDSLMGKLADYGIDDQFIEDMSNQLAPGPRRCSCT